MLDGILTARLVIRENTLRILRAERSRNLALFFEESVDIDWKSKITAITPKLYLTSLNSQCSLWGTECNFLKPGERGVTVQESMERFILF
jgi:hypothetical protein